MATTWHYRRGEEPAGPVAFHELVQLVRLNQLATDDLVREEWNPEWRPAALAVGLFHMAGRQDLMDRWEAEQAELRRRAELAAAAAATEAEAEAGWQQRLREVEAAEAAERAERDAERAALATETAIDAALAAALAEQDARERALEPTRLQRWLGRLGSAAALHRYFRWGTACLVANVVAAAILAWSETDSQRFPNRARLSSGVKKFPVWGDCEPGLYYFLLADAALLAGTAAYFGARTLERTVND